MAPENNWLSFSLSSMEMLNNNASQQPQMVPSSTMKLSPYDNSSSADSHHYYFSDNFYANGWSNTNQVSKSVSPSSMCVNNDTTNSMFNVYMDPPQIHHQPPPKLEDFLGSNTAAAAAVAAASLVRYSDSQTDTNDSSLTDLYDRGGSGSAAAYFSEHQQDLKTIAGFQAFSTNSGSEVEDSAEVARTQVMGNEFAGQCIESATVLAAYSQCPPTSGLSLGVSTITTNTIHCTEKAIVSADSESCKKITDTFGQRTSIYRGVTRHRWTGRYEAHLWDNSCRREGQARKGRQVYLGGYDKEDKAARSYDLAALKYWGPTATTNFPISNYTKELEDMKHMTKQEFIASLRRKSSGFSRGASIYRGVTRHHQQGRWQARIGRVAGNKDLYLGTFATEEEAAEAYDIAAIKFRGMNAVTNFEMNRYDVETIMNSALPVGGAAKKLKLSLEAEQKPSLSTIQSTQCSSNSSTSINFAAVQPVSTIPCGVPFDTTTPFYHHNLFQQHLHSTNGGTSDTSGAVSSMVTPMPLLPSPAEFFIWSHQPY